MTHGQGTSSLFFPIRAQSSLKHFQGLASGMDTPPCQMPCLCTGNRAERGVRCMKGARGQSCFGHHGSISCHSS